jgi:hypothetical protein
VSNEGWRSDERYKSLDGCSAPDLAWEFLRRNPDYRSEFKQTHEVASAGSQRADPARWARWGLSFRRRPAAARVRAAGVLAA